MSRYWGRSAGSLGKQGAKTSGRNAYQGDPLTKKAKEMGFAARSVFKLEEIHEKFRILRQGQRVLDLGCSPGSWAAYALPIIGPRGVLVGVDIQPPVHGGFVFLEKSVLDVTVPEMLEALGGPADVVLSDMAPSTTGSHDIDHLRQMALVEMALELATGLLAPGGAFVCKVFDGGEVPAFQTRIRPLFEQVKRSRPEAVRKPSREFFLVAQGFRPPSA